MSITTMVILSLALSMDAFAVSLSNGISCINIVKKRMFQMALFFCIAQGAMPFIGYTLFNSVSFLYTPYAKFISLIILCFLGYRMIKEGKDSKCSERFKFITTKVLLLQSIATSIDAFAVGVSFIASGTNVFHVCLIISMITFVVSFTGVVFGKRFGFIFGNRAEMFGGVLLILIGIRIFIT
ncbi:MAG: manganese efflux pump MntP family protein [Oscillospiraceae bacterium]